MRPENEELLRWAVKVICTIVCGISVAAATNNPAAGIDVLSFLVLWLASKK
jgi:hypothetical protein